MAAVLTLAFAIAGAACALVTLCRVRTLRIDQAGEANVERRLDAAVVVPARDEAVSLPVLLASIRASTHAPAELIVVDDHSTDGTGAIAGELGARVVTPAPPPEGWTGKNWACHAAAEATSAPTLVFLDADVRLAPGALDQLVRAHRVHGGLLSVQPRHLPVGGAEQLSAVFNAVSVMGSGIGAAWSRPGTARMAFGPCLVTSAAVYAEVGGHRAVRGEVVEDVALATLYRSAGEPVTTVLGGDVVAFRMYPDGLAAVVEGWTKNIATGARRAPLATSLLAGAWVASLAAVAVRCADALVTWAGGGDRPSVLLAAAWAVAAAGCFAAFRTVGRFRWWTWLVFPVPLAFFVVVFGRAALRSARRRPVTWRGRTIEVGA